MYTCDYRGDKDIFIVYKKKGGFIYFNINSIFITRGYINNNENIFGIRLNIEKK